MRLDRLLTNREWNDNFSETSVLHLARVCSDHAPLQITMKNVVSVAPRYFKFLDFWADNDDFLSVVKDVWEESVEGNPMWVLHQKLKKASKRLSIWSRETFGDIYEEPKRLEKLIVDLEEALVISNSPSHRRELNEAKAKYIQFLNIQDAVLRQKAKAQWLRDGDKNTAYFHAVIKGKRKKLSIQKIQDEEGQWREGGEEVAKRLQLITSGEFLILIQVLEI